jgi:hypothetical protein
MTATEQAKIKMVIRLANKVAAVLYLFPKSGSTKAATRGTATKIGNGTKDKLIL